MNDHPVILFDGLCNLCSGSVTFILKRDRPGIFRFAAQQSATGQALLTEAGLDPKISHSVIMLDGGHVYQKSAAALRITRYLRSPWPLMGVFLIVPRPIRDWVYDQIAGHRYRWFGKKAVCELPRLEWADRFLT